MRSGDTLIVEEDSVSKRQREEKQNEALLREYESQSEAGKFYYRFCKHTDVIVDCYCVNVTDCRCFVTFNCVFYAVCLI